MRRMLVQGQGLAFQGRAARCFAIGLHLAFSNISKSLGGVAILLEEKQDHIDELPHTQVCDS